MANDFPTADTSTLAFGANATQDDSLVITSGIVSFGGGNLAFAPSPTPAPGTAFTLISDAAGGVSGQQFATVNGSPLVGNTFIASGDLFTISETAITYVVTASAAPEPASLALLGLGAAGLFARRRHRPA